MLKKIVSVLLTLTLFALCAVPAFAADKAGFGEYDAVYIVGIDGAGAAFGLVDTPNFDRIFADNAYVLNGRAEYVTVSAQNWGSILCGVAYDVHGFTNGWLDENERGSDSANGSIFRFVREAYPDAELVSFNNWNAINHGLIENDLGVKKVHRATDPLVTQEIVSYFDAGNTPLLMFVQLDSVDHAAHAGGGFSRQYYNAVKKADGMIGDIYDALDRNGLLENGLFIVVADHGETEDGHGGQTVEESSVVVAVAGKSVNTVTLGTETRNRDVAAIALHALGVEQPGHMTAVLPENLFGETRDKETAKNPDSLFVRFWKDFGNFFVKAVNFIVDLFEGTFGVSC